MVLQESLLVPSKQEQEAQDKSHEIAQHGEDDGKAKHGDESFPLRLSTLLSFEQQGKKYSSNDEQE